MSLRVAEDLAFRDEFMLMSAIVLGMPETGKTTFAKKVCEQVWKIKQRFGAIDPKGDYYGLGSSSDGQSPAIPVVVFGGEHAHVPLDAKAGQYIANVVVRELDQPFIIDLEKLSKTKQIIFVADFLEELYQINRNPLLMVIDELQRFAPEKASFPEHPRCMGAVEDIFKLGRKHGLGRIGLTQRGAEANKSVTDTCDLLAAFRATGVLDQKRIKGWLDANVGAAEAAEALDQLSSLDTGQAIIASARRDIKVFKVVQIDELETFDTSATPGLKRRRREPKVLAQPELAKLHEAMAEQMERAAANDPKALKDKLENLRYQLASTQNRLTAAEEKLANVKLPREKVVHKEVKVPYLDPKLVRSAMARFTDATREAVKEAAELILKEAYAMEPVMTANRGSTLTAKPVYRALPLGQGREPAATRLVPVDPERGRAAAASRPASVEANGLGGPEYRILTALARLKRLRIEHPARPTVGALARYTAAGGHFKNSLAKLRKHQYIEYVDKDHVMLTEDGENKVDVPPTPATQEELHESFLSIMTGPQQRLIKPLIHAYPHAMLREELGKETDLESSAGHFKNTLGSLRKMQVIEYPDKDSVRATSVLFLQ